MALRIPKAEIDGTMRDQMVAQFGAVPEPVEVAWHSPKVATTSLAIGQMLGEWSDADQNLKSFAHMAVAARIGCSWCLDIAYFQAIDHDLDASKASQVPRWRASDVFTPLERDVMAYAEAMTATPTVVTDELYDSLLERLGPAAMVELTAYIAFANMAARNNVSHGISSQGFSDSCEVPLVEPAPATA